MKQKIISLALACFLGLTLLPAPARAYSTGTVGQPNIVGAGWGYTVFVDQNGVLWTWGNSRRLGNGGGGNALDEFGHSIQTVPIKILDNVASVSCSTEQVAAIKTDGSLWMWGSYIWWRQDSDGYIHGVSSDVPLKVMDNVAAVSCSGSVTAAIKTDGTLWMWGYNKEDALGNGGGGNALNVRGSIIQTVPIKVLDNAAAVSCGVGHRAVVRTDGTLWTWGSNSSGELGNGGGGKDADIETVPIQVVGLIASRNIPSYQFPEAGTAGAGSAAVQAAAQGAEAAAAYQLADGLYYILLDQDGGLVGRVVKGVKEGGQVVWKVIQSHDEPAAQETLDQLVADDAAQPNVTLDYGKLTASSTAQGVADYLQGQLDNMDGIVPNEAAKCALAAFVEDALSTLASKSVSSSDNRLTVPAGTVAGIVQQARDARAALEEVLERNGIALNRNAETVIRLLWQDVDSASPCQITLAKELKDAAGDCALQVLLGGGGRCIEISPASMAQLLDQYGTLSVQIAQTGGSLYTVSFLDETGEVLEQAAASVTVALPASGPLNTVMVSYAGGSDNWGGQYDGGTGTIAFDTRYSGQYEVLQNDIAISDIEGLDGEAKTAVAFLVSKGYMEAPDGVFQPGAPLSRYDFTQALVGMFFALDRSLTTTFPDVPGDSGYYAYVASAEAEKLVEGYDGNFFGEENITVEQMLAIAARTMRERKGYLAPEDGDRYLSAYGDADQVSDWARELVAQTVRDGIMDRGDALTPKGEVTRAQAALILYQLFLRLYEVPPVALELPSLSETPAASEAPTETEPADGETAEGGFPAWAVAVVSSVAAAGAGAIGAGIYFKKKKNQA